LLLKQEDSEVRFVVERRERKIKKETCWLYTQKTMVEDRKHIVKVKVDVAIAMFSWVVPRFVTPFCGLKPYTVKNPRSEVVPSTSGLSCTKDSRHGICQRKKPACHLHHFVSLNTVMVWVVNDGMELEHLEITQRIMSSEVKRPLKSKNT
jgi:hypothetical protein